MQTIKHSKKLHTFSLILFCTFSCSTQAADTFKQPASYKGVYKDMALVAPQNSWYMGLGAGESWINIAKNSTNVSNGSFAPPPSDQDTFSINNPSSQAQVQFDFGYRWHQNTQFITDYSAYFQYRHYFNTNIRGIVDQYSLPGFENYNYRLKYTADLFTINGKMNLFEYKKISPYVSAGVGIIYNSFVNYTETATDNVTPRVSPDYAGAPTNPAFTLGAGIDYKFTPNIWATLGYEYVTQTNLKSGNGNGSWSTTTLNFGHTNLNTVFLKISANVPDTFPNAFRS